MSLTLEAKKAIVNDILRGIGKTGKITTVLIFDHIEIEGTFVRKCTAHNLDNIKQNNIWIGSIIEVIKSGNEIIRKAEKRALVAATLP